MICPTCGKENEEQAVQCAGCGASLTAAPAQAPVKPRADGMAIASLVLGLLGVTIVTAIPGIILGIVSLNRINKSRGRLTGGGMAIAGIILSCLAIIIVPIAAAIAGFAYIGSGEPWSGLESESSCLTNAETLDMAVLSEAGNREGKLPEAKNWADTISPYLEDKEVFQCPEDGKSNLDYAYNANLSGLKLEDIAEPEKTVVIFESDLGWNGAGDMNALPAEPRHDDADVYAFADGHAEELSRDEAKELIWKPK